MIIIHEIVTIFQKCDFLWWFYWKEPKLPDSRNMHHQKTWRNRVQVKFGRSEAFEIEMRRFLFVLVGLGNQQPGF